MVSERTATANRRNAKKSTGPRSAEGKARASLNSIRHGLTAARPIILDGESEGELEALRTGFHQAWNPIGAAEAFLVERIVQHGWRMRRAERVEVELFSRQILADEAVQLEAALAPKFKIPVTIAAEFSSGLEPTDEASSGQQLAEKRLSMAGLRLGTSFVGLSSGEDLLGKLQRYETAAERSFFRAAHDLERLQRRRMGEDVEAPRVADLNIKIDPSGGVGQAAAVSPSSARISSGAGAEVPPKTAPAGEGRQAPVPSDYETNPESDAKHGNGSPGPRSSDRQDHRRDAVDTPRNEAPRSEIGFRNEPNT